MTFCEEIEVEENEEEDKVAVTNRQPRLKLDASVAKNTTAKGGSKRERKMLNKEEKARLITFLKQAIVCLSFSKYICYVFHEDNLNCSPRLYTRSTYSCFVRGLLNTGKT